MSKSSQRFSLVAAIVASLLLSACGGGGGGDSTGDTNASPTDTIAPTATSVTTVSKAIKVTIGGTAYYVPAYATFA